MMFYLHWLIYWLPLLLLISSCAWTVCAGGRESTSEEWPLLLEPSVRPIQINIPEVQPLGRRTVWIRTLILIAAITIGGMGGYASREHQLASNLWTYTDVSVTRKISDSDFWVWPDKMKQMHIQTCAAVDWREGEVLDDWTFEQRQGCKRVVSYHEKVKGELDASVQAR